MYFLKSLTRGQQWLLLGIICCAAFFRLYHIQGQGFLFWDEGTYMNEAKFYTSVVHHLPFVIEQVRTGLNLDALQRMLDGWPPSAAKPLHGIFIFIFSLFFGLHDYTGQLLSALFSLGFLILFFKMIAQYESLPVAFLSLFLLAVSPYHIMFSRSAFPEMDSAFFYLLSLWCYLSACGTDVQKPMRKLFWCGVLFGVTLTTNFRWFMVAPAFLLFEIIALVGGYHTGTLFDSMKRLVVLFAGTVSVIVLIDVPYYFINKQVTLPPVFGGYQKEFDTYVLFRVVNFIRHWTFRPLYVNIYLYFNGYVQTFLVVCGTLIILMKRQKTFLSLISVVLFFFVFLGISMERSGTFARNFSLVYPFSIFIASYGLWTFVRTLRRKYVRYTVLAGMLIFLGARGVLASERYLFVRSGYRDARDYLVAHNGQKALATTNSVFEFYFGRNVSDHFSSDKDSFLRDMAKGNFKYLVVDYAQFTVAANEVRGVYRFLRDRRQPVAVIDNPMGRYRELVLENSHYQDYPVDDYRALMSDPQTAQICIYETKGLIEAVHHEYA